MEDRVNHPSHYTDVVPGIECIQVAEHFSFLRGNAIKYLWRAGAKGNTVEDLQKAIWYIKREIDNLAPKQPESPVEQLTPTETPDQGVQSTSGEIRPQETAGKEEQEEPILRYFSYGHLPVDLQQVSKNFGALAVLIVGELPRNPERTVALRKLLEAKDAAVRAQIAKTL